LRLDRLTVAEVRSYLFALPLHPQTASHHRAVLRKALADAVTDGLLSRNVAALARPPTVPRPERRWLSGDELRALFDATSGTPLHALWVLAGTTGLRSAELLALAWGDVDLEHGSLVVRHTLHRERGEWLYRPTKTRATRSVPLTERAVVALRQHHGRQASDGLAVGVGGGSHRGLVFTSPRGFPLHAADLSRYLRADLEAAGLPVVTLHSLRHSAASHWLATGTPIQVIATLLGHSTPAVTAQLYLHVGEDLKRDAVRRADEAMR
jgi:integrase